MYIIANVDNVDSIFDYAENNAKEESDKKIIDDLKGYASYFTGKAYIYFPLTVGDMLSSGSDTNSDNYVLSFQFDDSNLLDKLDSNKDLSKSVINGMPYYEATDSGSKTYIYVNSDYINFSSLKPSVFSKLLTNARSPLSVKSYNLLKKYIKQGLLSFYWDIGEDLEKSMYLKAPFNEAGAVMNLDYNKDGDLQFTMILH